MNRTPAVASLVLVAVLSLSACGGASQGAPDTPRTPLPAPLAGAWFTGTLSSIQYYDRTTGRWQDPSGSGFYFVFGADGSYETGAVIDSTVAGCTLRLLGNEVGTATMAGPTLTLYRHRVTTHVTNSCGNSGERTLGQEARQLRWTVAVDEESGLEVLSLDHGDGSVERYRRWTLP